MTSSQGPKIFSIISIVSSTIYVLSSIIANTNPLASLIKILFGFLILTYIIGASLRIFLIQVVKLSNLPSTASIGGLSFDILVSLLITLGISTILMRTYFFNAFSLAVMIIPLIIILNFFILRKNIKMCQEFGVEKFLSRKKAKDFLPAAVPVTVLLTSCILFVNYFRSQTPFPMINGWDMNSSLAYINWIISHHGYNFLLIPSFPSGGTPYSAFFFFLVSAYSSTLGVTPYVVFWYGILPMIFGYMLLVFLIALKFSRDVWLSLTSAFVAFFTSAALAEVVRNPLYLTLDMVSQIIFLLIIVINIYWYDQSAKKNVMNIFAVFLLALFNYFAAIAVFPFLLWAIIGDKKFPLLSSGQRVFRISIILTALCASALIAVFGYLVPALSPLFSSSPFPLTLKMQTLTTIYPLIVWILVIFAFFSIIIYRTKNSKGLSYLDLLLYIALGFSLYFNPAWVTYRLEFYFRVFLAVFTSGIVCVFNNGLFKRSLNFAFRSKYSKKIRLGTIASFFLLIITVSLMYPLFTNYSAYAYISKDEYNAAAWIKNNTPSNAYMVTDPSSGYVIRAFTLRNASSYFVLPSGQMPADSSTLYPLLVNKSRNFLFSKTPLARAELCDEIPSNNTYIVITSRTVYWSITSSNVAITHPLNGQDFSILTDKLVMPYFREVYSSDTVKIYQPDPSLTVEKKVVYSDTNFAGNWTWYLDGSYGNHSFEVANNTIYLSTQAKASTSAWVGLTTSINCSGATDFVIESKLQGVPGISGGHPYMTEILLFNSSGNTIATFYNAGLSSNSVFITNVFYLTSLQADNVSKMTMLIWTKDMYSYIWEIKGITFSFSSFAIDNK